MFKKGDRIESASWPGRTFTVRHSQEGSVVLARDEDGQAWSLLAESCTAIVDRAASECLKCERADVLARFSEELAKATGDGSKKRKAGTKPPWYIDQSHEGAIFSHLTKWKRGEKVDPDSGAHPLVHLAWRALAIACQESGNIPS